MTRALERIVLAYSGGPESSVAIPWLAERHHAEIITVTLDLGRGPETRVELEDVRDRALAAGAVRAHVLDVREEFARDFIVPSLKADAVHEDRRPMAAALSRPLIARKLIEIAAIEQASAIAHGCGADDRDRLRIEAAARGIDPNITLIAPARDWGMTASREIAYANAQGIHVSTPVDSTDTNLWGRSGPRYTLTKASDECPSEPAYVDLRFEQGAPSAINGVSMPIVELIGSLGHIAGAHGVGRAPYRNPAHRDPADPDSGRHRTDDAGTPDVFEAPAAVALHTALKELRARVMPDDLRGFSAIVSRYYADIVDSGLWFSPLREALAAFVDAAQQGVTGAVRLKLFRGECVPLERMNRH